MILSGLVSIRTFNICFSIFEVEMTASVPALSRNAASHHDVEALNALMMFSSTGLLVTLLFWIEGFDIAASIF